MSISDNIKRLRESHGMSQVEFGKIAGVTDKAVSTWENGLKVPRMGAVQKIADYFNIPKSEILDDDTLHPSHLNYESTDGSSSTSIKPRRLTWENLTDNEIRLVLAYRVAPTDSRTLVDLALKLNEIGNNEKERAV